MGDGGAAALAAALRGRTGLRRLRLEGNRVGPRGALALGAALEGVPVELTMR